MLHILCRKARELGFVTTIIGRRRYLPDIKSADASKRAAAERRQAVNAVIQVISLFAREYTSKLVI
jgi:DNA polymerase I-like protein with 3'-5' exonuclease and polymerase domains